MNASFSMFFSGCYNMCTMSTVQIIRNCVVFVKKIFFGLFFNAFSTYLIGLLLHYEQEDYICLPFTKWIFIKLTFIASIIYAFINFLQDAVSSFGLLFLYLGLYLDKSFCCFDNFKIPS